MRTLATCMVWLWMGAGCLQPQAGQAGTVGEQDAAPDTTSSADGAAETGNCEPSSGMCVADPDCDDGDPCTIDSCVCVQDAACGQVCTCEHIAVPGECGLPDPTGCGPEGALEVEALLGRSPGFVKVGGVVAMDYGSGVCEDAECGTCTGGVGLTDPASGAMVQLSQMEDLYAWTCSSGGCPAVTSCIPMVHGQAYWVWGTVDDLVTDPTETPATAKRMLTVDGWCLQSFVGTYEGVVRHVYGYTMPVTLRITAQAAGYAVSLTELVPCDEAWCLTQPEQTVSAGPENGQGVLQLLASMPDGTALHNSDVALVRDGNGLTGSFKLAGLGDVDDSGTAEDSDRAQPPSGTIEVTRVP